MGKDQEKDDKPRPDYSGGYGQRGRSDDNREFQREHGSHDRHPPQRDADIPDDERPPSSPSDGKEDTEEK